MFRFFRHHRGWVASALVFALVVVGFSVSLGLQNLRLEQQVKRAEREQQSALMAVQFISGLLKEAYPEEPGRVLTVDQMVTRGVEQLERDLADEPRVQSRLLETLARVSEGIGQGERSDKLLKQALVKLEGIDDLSPEELASLLGDLLRDEKGLGLGIGLKTVLGTSNDWGQVENRLIDSLSNLDTLKQIRSLASEAGSEAPETDSEVPEPGFEAPGPGFEAPEAGSEEEP